MTYRDNSNWNKQNELKCLLIFKKLEAENFPRGKQIDYCKSMEKITNLSVGSISAKVCNYKSVAQINNDSNASKNTIDIYCKYGSLSISEILNLINKSS